jgi:hypothetical protein
VNLFWTAVLVSLAASGLLGVFAACSWALDRIEQRRQQRFRDAWLETETWAYQALQSQQVKR